MRIEKLIRELEEMGTLLELDGANPFKSGAYPKAARTLEEVGPDLLGHIEGGTLTSIKGIGKGLAEKIEEFHATGKIGELEELRNKIPHGLLDVVRIPGVGAKKARQLHLDLKISTIEDLKQACEEDRVAELKGFGEKTQEKILKGIGDMAHYTGRRHLDVALKAAMPILEELRAHRKVKRAEIAGSLRRWRETIGDLDFVVSTSDPEAVMEFFATREAVDDVIGRGETKTSVMLDNGMQADIRCVSDKEFPFALLHFTGSKEHNTVLRGRAKEMGLKLNEYGLFPEGKEKSLAAKSEEDIHKHLGLAYIPPEMREDMGEVEAAEEKEIPTLIERGDLRGVIHMHTVYSDGKPELEDYAKWAAGNGIEWMGISDHSRSLTIGNGLSQERVLEQHDEIDEVNRKYSKKKVRLLKGIESDILLDGSLDYPDDFLERFEFVIASVHSRFNLPADEQTRRIIKAMEHPATTILGHMTGRLLLEREGYTVDQKEIIRQAARLGVAIEINANPMRLDLDWRLVRHAAGEGCKLVISPDAHSMAGLDDLQFGIAMARKGWLARSEVLNCLSTRDFLAFAKSRRKK